MLVIWNPNAGSVEKAEDLHKFLQSQPDIELAATDSSDAAEELVRRRMREGERQIVAAGGDGTINAVLNAVMQAPDGVTLGVLPVGTANDWCSSLAIPDDLADAWKLIENGDSTPVDVAELLTPESSIYFANIATGGNSHRVTESITTEMKQTWGPLCYLRGAIGILADLETFHAQVSLDGQPAETFDVWNIIVANGRTSAGRLEIAPYAKLDDGLLDLIIIRDGTLLDVAGIATNYLMSAYIESDQVEYRQAKSIALRSNPPMLFSIDGDLVEQQPIEFKAHANALSVIVGDSFGSQ